MNKNNRVFVTFAISLQVFILLFATMVAPAGATEDSSPVLLFLYGNISLDGEPGPVGTEIVVKLNEDVVGSSSVYHEGLYGDEPNKRLSITCDPKDYDDITFYVNGNEAQIVNPADLENANSWDLVELDFIAESPAVSNGGSSGGSSGVSTGTATDTAVPGGAGVPGEAGEAAAGSTPGVTTTSEAEPSQMDKPISPVVIIAIIAIIGIAAFAIYKKLQ